MYLLLALLHAGEGRIESGANTTAGSSEVIGYYSWNWGSGSTGPPGANAGCAFTGYTDVTTALADYTPGAAWCCPALVGTKYVTLGGGNSAGIFAADDLATIGVSASKIQEAGYEGVMFDVEEVTGDASTMVAAFASAFKNLKSAGLLVAITTSHSAPYQTDDPSVAIALVKAWVNDTNVDIVSPQLYSSGNEASPEFAETSSCKSAGCTWDLYKGATPVIAPSLVDETQYSASKTYFSDNYNIELGGYFVWKQENQAAAEEIPARFKKSYLKGLANP